MIAALREQLAEALVNENALQQKEKRLSEHLREALEKKTSQTCYLCLEPLVDGKCTVFPRCRHAGACSTLSCMC